MLPHQNFSVCVFNNERYCLRLFEATGKFFNAETVGGNSASSVATHVYLFLEMLSLLLLLVVLLLLMIQFLFGFRKNLH